MEVKRIIRNLDGGVDAIIALDQEQTRFLINFALGLLVQQGLVIYKDMSAEEYEKDKASKPADQNNKDLVEAMSDAMDAADPKDLPQA